VGYVVFVNYKALVLSVLQKLFFELITPPQYPILRGKNYLSNPPTKDNCGFSTTNP
jgi:hypothetical protein